MKSISLRTLLREPLRVKRMTRSGQRVQVTDNGKPLWVLQAPGAVFAGDDKDRIQAAEEIFAEVMEEKPSDRPLSNIITESRQ